MNPKLCTQSVCALFPTACPIQTFGVSLRTTLISVRRIATANNVVDQALGPSIVTSDVLSGQPLNAPCGADVFFINNTGSNTLDIRPAHNHFIQGSIFTPMRWNSAKPILNAEHIVAPNFVMKTGIDPRAHTLVYPEPGDAVGDPSMAFPGTPMKRELAELLHLAPILLELEPEAFLHSLMRNGRETIGEFTYLADGKDTFYSIETSEAEIDVLIERMKGLLPGMEAALNVLSPSRNKTVELTVNTDDQGSIEVSLYLGKASDEHSLEDQYWFEKFDVGEAGIQRVLEFIKTFRFRDS